MKFYALFVHAGNTKLVGQCKKKMMYKLINIRCLFTEFVVSFFKIFVGDTLLWVRTPLTRGVLDTTLCDKVCQWFATGLCFSPATPVSSIKKTDRHDITEISLKVLTAYTNHLHQIAFCMGSCQVIFHSSFGRLKIWTLMWPPNKMSLYVSVSQKN
jgi:hypothetical protein